MSELPIGWADTTVGDIAYLSSGYGFPKHLQGKSAGSLPFAKVSDISAAVRNDESQLYSAENYVDESDLSTLRARPVPSGSTVFAKIGEALKLNRRALAAVDLVLDNNCMALSPQAGIEPRFLFHFMKTVDLAPLSIATTVPSVRKGDIECLRIGLPPETEQRRIVAKLDRLRARSSRARQELDRIPKLIERYKQAILAKAFSGELTADWRKKYDTKGWQPATIEDVAASIFDGPFGSNLKSDDYVNDGVRVIRLENIGHLAFKGDKRTFISKEKYDQLRRHTLLPDDVIFSSFVDEEVRVCLFPDGLDTAAINKADCFCIRPKTKVCEPKWLTMRLACRSTYETLRDAVHGATRPRISLGTLKSFSFDLPTSKEQREIVRRIDHAFAWLDKIATEHARAEHLLPKLDQAILAKAFRGELVPQDPNDEPAAVLLERIKRERDTSKQPTQRRAASA